ncbi:hypothetical protein [Agromyces kandeliae]|uniref:Uncharacterized protein n=1 Tax=Agromyces kandeliae TaxID=2666141 RepID=A0A6L5R5H2_9MICO|nr:hypothetical protein [Agromyces kandeliae]MRX44588.1 hypothetical protein [Agromyces kandeliae]
MSTESMPRTVIWWGVAIALAGGLLVAAAPYALTAWWGANTAEWSAATVVFEVVLAIARTTLAPLGAALIAAGLVMHYVDRRLRGDRIADRPHRWRFPNAEEAER